MADASNLFKRCLVSIGPGFPSSKCVRGAFVGIRGSVAHFKLPMRRSHQPSGGMAAYYQVNYVYALN